MVENVRTRVSTGPSRTMPGTVQRAVGKVRQALPRAEVRERIGPADLSAVRPTALLLDGRDARAARRSARRLGLPRTFDDTAAWAALGGLSALLRIADDGKRSAVVVDPNSPRSVFSRWADAVGFAPVGLDIHSSDPTSTGIEPGAVDVVALLHPASLSPGSADVALVLSAEAVRKGGLIVATVRLGPSDESAMSIADLRSLIARMAEQGLVLVGDLDLDEARRARAVQQAERGSFGLALLTFRRR